MRKLIPLLFLAAIGLASCGGEDDSLTPNATTGLPPGTTPAPEISSVELITDNPQIPSDGGIPATITAFIKDTANNFVSGVDVLFSASSGGIAVTQGTTNDSGVATASLSTAGDPTNRTITITATAGELSSSIDVSVTGSQLTLTGPDSLVQNDVATYTLVLVDGGGNGISGETLTISSSAGNTLAASTLTTDSAGQAQVELTATQGGSDTLTASGLDLTETKTITVSDDSFSFLAPGENEEIVLGAVRVVTVEWLKDGMLQVGKAINFSTTRGEFVGIVGPPVVSTNGSGQASISIRADNAGPAVVTAEAADNGPTTTLPIEFVATLPATIEAQADPFTVAPGNQTTITATVRDAENNRVKNSRVQFSLSDVTGGTLSVGSAETDSQGRAQTFYTANDVVSGNLGVQVTALIESAPTINDTVDITVARRELFIAFGTGNELAEPDPATYEIDYIALVTDSEGNGVPDANVQFDVRSTRYIKGPWRLDTVADEWFTDPTDTCADEDLNGNGILDPGEFDENNNGTIEAGNVVAVVGGNTPTDADGRISFKLRYPQVYGAWTEVRLRGQLTVAGTEFAEDLQFVIPVLAEDVTGDAAPPGLQKPPDPANGFPLPFLSSPWGYGICPQDF